LALNFWGLRSVVCGFAVLAGAQSTRIGIVRCRQISVRYFTDMTNDARLEIRLPAQQRQKLDQLAKETGFRVGTLMRLAAMRLANDDRETLLKLVGRSEEAA
jgi:hypothetical protein